MCIVRAGFKGFWAFVTRIKSRCNMIGIHLVIPHDTIHSTLCTTKNNSVVIIQTIKTKMGMTMILFQVKQERLEHTIKNNETLFEIDPNEECDSINIDKSWDAIKFILKQISSDSIVSKVISSGQEIGEFDEYDVYEVNYLTAEQVRDCIIDLNEISKTHFEKNFDIKAMNDQEVYLESFDESAFDYLFENFMKIQTFYSNAAANNNGVITYLS